MLDNFVTWGMLATYGTLVLLVFMVVEFLKEIPPISKVKTKYVSFFVALVLILMSNGRLVILKEMVLFDFLMNILLYILTAALISLTGNGLSDYNNKVLKDAKDEPTHDIVAKNVVFKSKSFEVIEPEDDSEDEDEEEYDEDEDEED